MIRNDYNDQSKVAPSIEISNTLLNEMGDLFSQFKGNQ
jgi:hypothetical protein